MAMAQLGIAGNRNAGLAVVRAVSLLEREGCMGLEVSRITLAWTWVAKLFVAPVLAGSNAAGAPGPLANSEVEIGDTYCRETSQQGIRRVKLVNRTNE